MENNVTNIREIIQHAMEKVDPSLPLNEKKKIEEVLIKLLEKNESPQKAFEISDAVMEVCYKQGYILFKAGKYKEAIKIFESLRYLNPFDARYSLAIGAGYHYLKDYSKAAANYMICKEIDQFNPVPSFHLYDCLMKLDQPLLAVKALAEVIVKSEDLPAYKEMKEKALLEKDNLNDRLQEWFKKNYEFIPTEQGNKIIRK